MVGILVSFWDGLFSGAMLVSGSVFTVFGSIFNGLSKVLGDPFWGPHFAADSHWWNPRPEIDKGRPYKLPVETFWKYPKRWCTKDHEKTHGTFLQRYCIYNCSGAQWWCNNLAFIHRPQYHWWFWTSKSSFQNPSDQDFWKTEVTFISLTVYAWNTKSDVTGMGSSLKNMLSKKPKTSLMLCWICHE